MIGVLKKIFGTKYDRDVKVYLPLVEETNLYFEQYQSLSNDELRNKTPEFRERIKDHLKGVDEDIASIRIDAEQETDFGIKEELYIELDELTEARDKHLENVLLELLPETFAVVKETCRRFVENEFLEVTCTEHDSEIASRGSYVSVEGDRAFWKNKWTAAGGDVEWNMIHYDVQLIGGMVLHDGKIGEMATGEGKTLVATLPSYLNGLAGLGGTHHHCK